MPLFGEQLPEPKSYVGISLDGLRADPAWTEAIVRAGLDIDQCELVLRLGSATVGIGREPGSPHVAQPALLLGHGDTLAIAFPGEREVRVVRLSRFNAELQTQPSGTFQILFASVNQLDVWIVFDDLKLGTPEGEQFGQTMLQFLRGQAARPAVVLSPSSSASPMAPSVAEPPAGAPAPPPSPKMDPNPSVSSPANQDEETAHQLAHRLAAACSEVIRLQSACYEQAERVQKAHYVASQPQAPASRATFLGAAARYEQQFATLLNEFQGASATGRALWSDFTFLSRAPDQGMDKLLIPLVAQGVLQGDEVSNIMVGGIFLKADFGSTIDSFLETDSRLGEMMKSMGAE